MLNIREVLRRLIKYLVMVLIISYSVSSIPKLKLECDEILFIGFISGTVFALLDIFVPSISVRSCKKSDYTIGSS